ncbi:MAG: hypothetical protein CAK90_06255 [Spartobacteria bacterium AMD-G4]|jgi:hypothetical protein|nr:MAG: hypothetical protein CAK90_06255 [Spartobacteria bacterium AMD-G4]
MMRKCHIEKQHSVCMMPPAPRTKPKCHARGEEFYRRKVGAIIAGLLACILAGPVGEAAAQASANNSSAGSPSADPLRVGKKILDRHEVDLGNRTITYDRLETPRLKPHPDANACAQAGGAGSYGSRVGGDEENGDEALRERFFTMHAFQQAIHRGGVE